MTVVQVTGMVNQLASAFDTDPSQSSCYGQDPLSSCATSIAHDYYIQQFFNYDPTNLSIEYDDLNNSS
jgi:hypothetical protein